MSVADSASAAMLRVLEAIASEMDRKPSAEMASAAINVYEAVIESSIALGDGSDAAEPSVVPDGEEPEGIRSMPIETLGLDTRYENVLHRMGCKTVDDVTELTPVDILLVRQCGPSTVGAIKRALEIHGLILSEDEPLLGGAL